MSENFSAKFDEIFLYIKGR